MKLRILVISHSAIQPTYHKKLKAICKHDDVQMRVLVPEKWLENYQTLRFSEYEAGRNLQFYAGKVTFSGYGSRFFFIKGIIEHFRKFKPEIIHLEEEPWTLCTLQTIILKRIFCPRSKLIFRTSLSIPSKLRFNFIGSIIEKITFRKSDYAFILSKRAGEILVQKGYHKAMKVSPNGVDTEIFREMDVSDLKHELGIGGNEFVIGYVGRLMQMKGLANLLEAVSLLAQHSECRLLLVGSGEYKEEMLSIISRLGIGEKVIFVDTVPAAEVPRYINCMDTLVLPSITTPVWVEFFGRVLVEAMVCKVPAIGSNSGEIPNVIGDAGLVFREGDSDDLKDKLLTLIENPDLRQSLAEKGLARANSLFTWESIAQETYETYRTVAIGGPKNEEAD